MNQRKLLKAVKELYFAGKWICLDLTEEQETRLWKDLRDAAEIPIGSATKAKCGK